MNLAALKRFCSTLRGAVETRHAAPANVLAYSVGGKSFAYFKTSDPEKWLFSIRGAPDRFLELTDTPGIKPARYMGRFHWVTIVRIEPMPDEHFIELIMRSYHKAVSSLSRKKRTGIGTA